MIYSQHLAAVDPLQLAIDSGATRWRRFSAPTPPVVRPELLTHQLRGCCNSCGGLGIPPDYGRLAGYLGGLGQDDSLDTEGMDYSNLSVPSQGSDATTSVLQTISAGASMIPGIGTIASVVISTFGNYLKQMETWLHIGAGRKEADLIVPIQNNLMSSMGGVTNQILTGQLPSLGVLLQLYSQVWTSAVAFQEFVLQKQFKDRRASGQALNTIMPYMDGSCGYAVPVGFTATPSQFNCLQWGNGTIGGVGSNGMLGALGRAIVAAGGTIPQFIDIHTAANQGIPVQKQVITGTGGGTGTTGGGIIQTTATGGTTVMGVDTTTAAIIGVIALLLYQRGVF